MFTLRDMWAGVALPLVVSAAAAIAFSRIARHRLTARVRGAWAGPLALGLGFSAGYTALFGLVAFPPIEAHDWLLYLAIPLAALATLDAGGRLPLGGQLAASIAVSLATLALVVWPILANREVVWPDAVLVVAAATIVLAAWTMSLELLAGGTSTAQLSAILLGCFAAAAFVLALSGSQRLAQVAAALTAADGGILAAHLLLGPAGTGEGIPLVACGLFGGLLVCGHQYAELTSANLLLLLAAPQAAWLGQLWSHRDSPWPAKLAQTALVAAISICAVTRAWLAFAAEAAS